VLTYACSYVVERILIQAHLQGKKFRVIVADGRPMLEGRGLLQRLTAAGVECSYALLNGLSYVMSRVSKVFVGAYAMLANGCLISRVGTAVVAMMAQHYHVPFLVCCETYKFHERVQLDSICFNELADPDALITTDNDYTEAR
jgi:translation initiation factor eIF-2B subunit delta